MTRALPDLPQALRWREWMRRIEAVLFASASPVRREDLARVVGQGVSVDLLIADLSTDLEGRAGAGPERIRYRRAGGYCLSPAGDARGA